ncbi:MAG: hypothetical protein ABSG53_26450 [Thermoguttaceae bacterium]|jgi:hypothetical protein
MEIARNTSPALRIVVRIASDITQLVGSTPMMQLTRITSQPEAAIFA